MTRPYRTGAVTPVQRLALGLSAGYAGSLSDIPLDPGAGGRSIAESALQPGDVLVSTTRDRVSGLIRGVTDSQVSHAAIVLKNGQVAESLGSGVGVKPISEALSDDVLAVALRPVPPLTSTQVDQLDAWVRTQIGVPYNYIGVGGQGLFRLTTGACDHLGFARDACERARHRVVMSTAGDNSWFCSELVIQAFQRVGHPLGNQPAMSQAPSDIAALMGSRLAYVGHARYDPAAFSQSVAMSRGLSAEPALDIGALVRAAVADGLTEAEARALYADMGIAPPVAGSAGLSRGLDASGARTIPQGRVLGSINDPRGRAVMRAIDQAIQRAGLSGGTTVQAMVASLGSRPLTTIGIGLAGNAGLFIAASVGAGFLICSDGRVGTYSQNSSGVGWVGSITGGVYVTAMKGGPETFDGRSQMITVSAGPSEGPGIEYQHIMTMDGRFAGFAFGVTGSLGVPLLTAIEGTYQIGEGRQRSGRPFAVGQGVGSYSRAVSGGLGLTRALTADRVVEVRLRGFIPSPAVALIDERVPMAGGCYVGDGRTFSYSGGTHRFQLTGRVTIPSGGGGGGVTITDRDWGESQAFPDSMTVHPAGRPFWWRDLLPGAAPSRRARHPVADDNLVLRPKAAGVFSSIPAGHTIIQALVIGANPLASGSPTIDADLALDFYYDGGALKCRVSGDHDGFPAYELYLDGRLVYSHDPVAQSQTPVSLFPPAEFDVDFVTSLSAGSLGYGARGFDAPSSAAPAPAGSRDGSQGPVRWRLAQLDGPHPAGASDGTFQPVSFEALGRIEAPTGGEISARFPVTFEASGSQIRNVRIADPTVQASAVGWTLNVENTVDTGGGPATLRFNYRFASSDGGGDTLTLTYVLNPNGEVKRTASWASTGGAPGSAKPLSARDEPRRAYA